MSINPSKTDRQQSGVETLYQHQATLNNKLVSLASRESWAILLPRIDMSWRADVLKTPQSHRSGFENITIFCVSIFLFLAGSGELCRCTDLTSGSIDAGRNLRTMTMTMTSNLGAVPVCQGTSIRPSGRFPSDWKETHGVFFVNGVFFGYAKPNRG